MSESAEPPIFLDVPSLLESSEPRPRVPWFWYVAGTFATMMFISALSQGTPEAKQAIEVLSGLVMIGLLGLLAALSVSSMRKLRGEQQAVENVGELVQLRRWPQAAWMLEQILSRPARTQQLRAQALIFLSMVLSRYHRFEDAISIHNRLLEEDLIDNATALALRLSRAMAMLREDHLFDADRAISELRRVEGAESSAALKLVEIYRDVKTGHPEDALRMFDERLPILRDQLGHRVADAYALAARAYDLRERTAEAADAWRKATLLAPADELRRRYPELEKLEGRYQPSTPPP